MVTVRGLNTLLRSWIAISGLSLMFVLVTSLAVAEGYQEYFDPDDDTPTTALHGNMPVGEDDGWSSHMRGGFYLLENRTDPTNVRYYYVLPSKSTWRSPGEIIRVDVGGMFIGGDFHSGAGLLIRFDPATRNYYAFVLQENQTYAFYRRDDEGIRPLLSGSSDAIKRVGRNRLEVQLHDDAMHLLINDIEIGNVSSPKIRGAGVGLLALGEGRFEFDNFQLPNADIPGQSTQRQRVPGSQSLPSHAQYQGRFEGQQINVEFYLQDGEYTGVLQLGSENCQLTGRYLDAAGSPAVFAQPVQGTVRCGVEHYQFEAQLKDKDTLHFTLEGIDNQLKRKAAWSSPQSQLSPLPSMQREQTPAIAQARGPPPKLPAAFRLVPHRSASGDLLLKKEPNHGAAVSTLIRHTLDQFAGYFDARPRPLQAFGDLQETELQVTFNAHLNGKPVQGIATAKVSGQKAITALAFDEPRYFQHSLPVMMRALQAKVPKVQSRTYQMPPLEQTTFPDRSGSIDLPAGWYITSATKGMVDAAGPDGSMLALGIHGTAYTPQGAAQFPQGLHAAGVPIIPYSDLVSTFAAFWEELPRAVSQALGKQQPSQRVIRIIEYTPTVLPGGWEQAGFIDIAWEWGDTNPVPYRSLALFGMLPGYTGTWTYYSSVVSSPAERFEQNIPTLTKIWESYRVAGSVHAERLTKAFEGLQEIGRIINQVNTNRQASMDAIHADWTEYTTGRTNIRDTEGGDVHDAPLYEIDRLVLDLNEMAGYERYVHIPLQNLE